MMRCSKLFVLKCVVIICYAIFSSWNMVNAQENNIDVSSALWNYVNSMRDEKLYVHTDKDVYTSLDTIWLRAYLVNAITNHQVDYSRYIYVELVDRLNTVHWREKVQRVTNDSLFLGYFPIPDVPQGEYFLRCYTYYMQNLEEDFLYRKRIRILNPYDHRVVCKTSLRELGDKRGKILTLRFENQQGELYTNVDFNYRISGITPKDTFNTLNSGYNGIVKLRVDNNAEYLWIKSTQNCKLHFEKYIPLMKTQVDYDVQFFPEGGVLLSGIRQKVAFKAVGSDGLGVPIQGKIYNNQGDSVCSFSSNELGMGSFMITSFANDSLFAICESESNVKRLFRLPVAVSSGMNIVLDFVNDEVVCNIKRTSDNEDSYKKTKLLIYSRAMPLLLLNSVDVDGRKLNLSTAPEGIIHFALLDSLNRKLSERLWFHRRVNREKLDINIVNKPQPRGMADCIISILGTHYEDTISGVFSVSVVNNAYSSVDVENYGIESCLLLSSDLKGYIEKPSYYFENNSIERQYALDNLLLTQGWSRFSFDNIISSTSMLNNSYYMERGQHLSGYVKNFWGRDSKNAKITLLGSNGVACEVRTDSVGRFIANNIQYERGTTFVAQAISQFGRKSLELLVDVPEFKRPKLVEPDGIMRDYDNFIHLYAKDYVFSDKGERLKTLGLVTVTQESDYNDLSYFKKFADEIEYEYFWRGKEDPEKYGHHKYTGKNHYDYDSTYNMHGADPTKNRVTLFDAVLPKHLIQEQQQGRPRILGFKHVSPLQTVDGGHGGYMRNSDVSGIYLYGGDINTSGSIIPVYDMTLAPKIEIKFNMQTFVPSAPQTYNVEFYIPKYNVVADNFDAIIDEQATRYWNPGMKLSSNNKQIISFPTSGGDKDNTYIIIVDGITDDGTPIHKIGYYKL